MNGSEFIIKFYGITKDFNTNNFMMVMEYANNGNLRQELNKNFNLLSWIYKFAYLQTIANGLSNIHKKGLTHRDFHSGNILSYGTEVASIICKTVYGVLPYVAPEVLRGKKYTKESDVYSFGIIIYDIFNNGLPPYHDVAHDELLGIKICNGLRPKFNTKVPQLMKDVVKQCVDADPLKRPTTEYLYKTFLQWCGNLISIMLNMMRIVKFINKLKKQMNLMKNSRQLSQNHQLNLHILHILKLFIQVDY